MFRVFPAFLLAGGLFSCSLLSLGDTISLQAPPDGPVFPGGGFPEQWNIRWLGEGGREHEQLVKSPELDGIHLEIPRERAVVILAEPLGSPLLSPFGCAPAGAVLSPGALRPQSLQLSWENGFAATILLGLARNTVAPEAFNLKRFVDLCASRSNGNPWNLDSRLLIGDMLSGNLRVYSFQCLPIVETDLELPISGPWYPEYPLSPALEPVSGRWSGFLSVGLHRFSTGPLGPAVEFYIDRRGRATRFFGEEATY